MRQWTKAVSVGGTDVSGKKLRNYLYIQDCPIMLSDTGHLCPLEGFRQYTQHTLYNEFYRIAVIY
jgi:hypothetical protein